MPNSSATEVTNTGLTVVKGKSVLLRDLNLDYDDAEQPDSQITYTITTALNSGTLGTVDGQSLGLNASFTQADLDAGRIIYRNSADGATSATFGFQVTDGLDGYVGGKTFTFTV